MEKIRDFIPKTYMPIFFGSIILAVFGFLGLLKVILSEDVSFKSQLNEIKSLRSPNKFLFADTLIIDEQKGSSGMLIIKGRLRSDLNFQRKLVLTTIYLTTGGTKYSELQHVFNCTGCKHDTTLYCECLPVLRSNLHNEIYVNIQDTLDEEASSIIGEIIMETYLFWIVPFLFLYYKITQLLYHYLDRKIKAKKH